MNKNVELFKKSYKNGFEVYLNPEEKDKIIEYIETLELDLDSANSKLSNISKKCGDAIELINKHKHTECFTERGFDGTVGQVTVETTLVPGKEIRHILMGGKQDGKDK